MKLKKTKRTFLIKFLVIAILILDFVIRKIQLPPILSRIGIFGLILGFSGIALRAWSASVIKKGKELAISGPYALCRNPLYLGSFLILLGANFLIADSLTLFVTLVSFSMIHAKTVIYEEEFLSAEFGDKWLDYVSKTPRYFPNLKLKCSMLKTKIDLGQYVRNKEYNALLAFCLFLIFISFYQNFWM